MCCLAAEGSGDEVLVSDSTLIDHELGIRYDLLACQQQRQRLLCMAVKVCLKSIWACWRNMSRTCCSKTSGVKLLSSFRGSLINGRLCSMTTRPALDKATRNSAAYSVVPSLAGCDHPCPMIASARMLRFQRMDLPRNRLVSLNDGR